MDYDSLVKRMVKKIAILEKIEENTKIRIRDDGLSIDSSVWYQPLKRLIYGDTRSNTLQQITDNVSTCVMYVDQLNKRTDLSDKEVRDKEYISDKLEKCIKGLDNFRTTYKNDINIETQIEQLKRDIELVIHPDI